ncbi:NAD(P)-dependent oxidoreductase [Sphingomonas daechungensis]|uniref:NAD(P)-dependent oxidoreductase n=1 Tax=Sphingomonas daechungensis TaxID=1176646 RepID=A0ABX6T137_9SPHN|nr:NAD(P)-dependent oxidoreductase [Sphingomonas daechungensis]QNP43109.1 NAD(P)-dependent oxidoreductase [Sphingomonas daechungensis]
MKVLVTGATGFLGRAVVRALAERGHEVVAMARPAASLPQPVSPNVNYIRGDLRQGGEWCKAVRGVDAVVHAAASTGGGFPDQFAGTVVATENLLNCIDWESLQRFVLISSFSVYDYAGGGRAIDEKHPLEPDPSRRDAYTWTKMLQEDLAASTCAEHGVSFASIRPGAIYGPGKDWDSGAAMKTGKFELVFSPLAKLRLTHVDNCAEAIAAAVEKVGVDGVFNIVDDEVPTHAGYHRACRAAGSDARRALYVPWWFVASMGLGVRLVNRLFFGGKARLPEILDYPRQKARWRPFNYSNAKAKAELGWEPRVRVAEATRLMFGKR